jgi:gliding motility-associated-like protein
MYSFLHIRIVLLLFAVLTVVLVGRASHIRAGEITATRVNNTTYTFTLVVYANLNSPVRDDSATFDFGDGTTQEVFYNYSEVVLSADTYKRTYICTKVFSGSGTFRVSYTEIYRNAGIKNISQPSSTPFYVETYISISPYIGVNNPLQLTIPPIDKAAVGKLFVHNPGAYNPDGDSLSYALIVPMEASGTPVNGYFIPPASTSLTLNPVTGDLIWNTPTQVGIYNVAMIISQWRKNAGGSYSRIDYVERDMQIDVVNSVNNPPVVIVPDDTCVVAGSLLVNTIKGTDQDGNMVYLTAFPPNNFTVPANPQPTPASGTFSWQTQCSDIREQPYFFVFEAKDKSSSDTLTNYKTWQIRVYGPAPTGLLATPTGNSMVLSWNAYSCSNAQSMTIYRLTCDSSSYTQSVCEAGLAGFPGYVPIGSVPIGTTTFMDTNIKRGIKYCYLIVANFPLPQGGTSYASTQTCASAILDVPLLTNISVSSTSTSTGSISVNWMAPIASTLPTPYTYNLYRAKGPQATLFVQIASNLLSTTYIDSSIDTQDSLYFYKVALVGGGTSDPASSILLSTIPSNNAITLNWKSSEPWKEDSVYLYRKINGGNFSLLKRFIGNPQTYIDNNGLVNCDTACYYIKIFASYCDPMLPAMVYADSSETSCGSPTNTEPPVAPTLSVTGCNGDIAVFYDLLNWNDVSDPNCDNIKNYNVYYSDYQDGNLQLIGTTNDKVIEYTYTNYQSTAGCFAVSAVNKVGIEGAMSNKICVDDCVFYELPDLVTPNGDSLNDKFVPFPIPRGVKMVTFKVYNRWGTLVFSTNKDTQINWTSVDNSGQKVSDGVYFFAAELTYFHRLKKSDEFKILKGWVQVLDNCQLKTTD